METSHKPRSDDAAHAALDGVSATLCIPLLARAFGDAWFPSAAIGDRGAAAALSALGRDDREPCWIDPATAYGVLVRTRVFREWAGRFIARRPTCVGVNLGCGLADYFQWLDNGRNRWVDADLQAVVALRRALMPASSRRQRVVAADVTQPGWWSRLRIDTHEPSLVICEGLLMYLEPSQVKALLGEIATHAPPGTEILLDAICWLAVGHPWWCPSVYRTGVPFRWGLRSAGDLAAMHPRLRLSTQCDLAQECGLSPFISAATFRFCAGVPFYGVYRLIVGEG